MVKINKFITFFIAIVFLLTVLMWRVLQLPFFSEVLSKKITNIVESQVNAKIYFSGVKFKLYPIGVTFHDVKFQIDDVAQVDINAKIVDVDFSLIDLILNKMTIKNFSIQTGTAHVNIVNPSAGATNKNIKDFIDEFEQNGINALEVLNTKFNELYRGRINSFELNEINLLIEPFFSTYIERLQLNLLKNEKKLSLKFEDIKNGFGYMLDGLELSIDLNLKKKILEIPVCRIEKDFTSFDFKGNLLLDPKNLLHSKGDFQTKFQGQIKSFLNIIKVNIPGVKIEEGYVDVSLGFSANNEGLSYKGKIRFEGLNSNLASSENISFEIDRGDLNELVIQKLLLTNGSEYVSTHDSQIKISWKDNLKIEPFKVTFQGLKTKSILKFLDGKLDPLDAEIDGTGEISLRDNQLEIKCLENSKVKNLSVDINNLQVLGINYASVEYLLFKVDIKNGILDFSGAIDSKNSKIRAVGTISKNGVKVNVSESYVDLSDFEKIAGLDFEGVGDLKLKVEGPLDNVIFSFDINMQNGKVFNLNLGDIEGNIGFNLKESLLTITDGKGIGHNSLYKIDGMVSLKEKKTNLRIDLVRSNYKKIREIFSSFLKDVHVLPDEVMGEFGGVFYLTGGTSLETLVVSGEVKSKSEIIVYNEKFEEVSSSINFTKKILKFENVKIKKDHGEITGYFKKDLNTDLLESKYYLSKVPLEKLQFHERFGFGLMGDLKGYFYLKKVKGDKGITLDSKLELVNGHILENKIPDSIISIEMGNQILEARLNLVGEMLILRSVLDLENLDNKKRSNLTLSMQSDELGKFFSIFSVHNASDKGLKGGISFILNSSFNIKKLEELDLDFFVDEFYMVRKNFDLSISKEKNFGRIRNGKVENWEFLFLGDGNFFESTATGKLNENFILSNNINLDLSFVELFSEKFFGIDGKIIGPLTWQYDSKVSTVIGELDFSGVDFAYDGIPGIFEDCSGKMKIKDKEITVNNMDGRFSNGKFNGSGMIGLYFPYPSLNLTGKFDQSYFQLFQKSNMVYSGEISIIGNTRPYNLKGRLEVNRGSILDEFEKMGSGGQKGSKKINAYLPLHKRRELASEWFNADIKIDSINNLLLKNSKTVMEYMGDFSITGGLSNKLFNGNLNLIPGSGKIYFKNNDFILSKGNIVFDSKLGDNKILIDFEGQTKITDYIVNLKIFGQTDDFTLELNSKPALSKKNILSLLTLGYTEDVSKTLEAQDRQSLAQAGIGTIILDRLKLDENVEEMFGFNLVVAPELMEEGEININKQENSRLRSATKIGIKKKVNKKIDLSGNVTVGGQTRKQSMNVDYKLGKKTSLQGVYETTTGTGEQEKQNAVSTGADLKFRWTFK